MRADRDILIRYLDGSLTDPEVVELERRLSAESALQEELARLRVLGQTVSSGRADGFGAFFAERTMRAILPERAIQGASSYDAMKWVFLRTAAAGLAVVVILGALNMLDNQGLDIASTWIEAAFGLPSTTVQDAFSYGFI